MIRNTNDGSSRAPYLRTDLNLGSIVGLPDFSRGPRGPRDEIFTAIGKAGYAGVQVVGGEARHGIPAGLALTASGRVDAPAEAARLARAHKNAGFDCSTVHVGNGLENDAEIDRLISSIVEASEKFDYPIYVETHRATVTQDMRRTVDFVARLPEVRFNGDFSHWYTGQEMTYGNFEAKLDFISPVLERVRFLHGRIGNSACMQVDIGDGTDRPHVDHFKQIWTRAMSGFLETAQPGDYLCFAPELLPAHVDIGTRRIVMNYARLFPSPNGGLREESDRWEQAGVLTRLARECWEAASAAA
jgi:hypothetical protein